MTPNSFTDIRSEFGRDSIRGGTRVGRTFPSVLDTASVHSGDLDGVGERGALTGSTGACFLAVELMRSRAVGFMIATPSSTEIIVDSQGPARAQIVSRVAAAQPSHAGIASRAEVQYRLFAVIVLPVAMHQGTHEVTPRRADIRRQPLADMQRPRIVGTHIRAAVPAHTADTAAAEVHVDILPVVDITAGAAEATRVAVGTPAVVAMAATGKVKG
jgi:hypothetical protein